MSFLNSLDNYIFIESLHIPSHHITGIFPTLDHLHLLHLLVSYNVAQSHLDDFLTHTITTSKSIGHYEDGISSLNGNHLPLHADRGIVQYNL